MTVLRIYIPMYANRHRFEELKPLRSEEKVSISTELAVCKYDGSKLRAEQNEPPCAIAGRPFLLESDPEGREGQSRVPECLGPMLGLLDDLSLYSPSYGAKVALSLKCNSKNAEIKRPASADGGLLLTSQKRATSTISASPT